MITTGFDRQEVHILCKDGVACEAALNRQSTTVYTGGGSEQKVRAMNKSLPKETVSASSLIYL